MKVSQKVKTSEKTYSVILNETYDGLALELNKIKNITRFIIITEKKIANLYSKDIEKEITNTGRRFDYIFIAGGEKNKHLANLLSVYNKLIKLGVDRNTVILSLGGGVVGDFAGFVAATFLRGIRFVQLPTTLLACVDSSVGGKVAVNVDLGKNMVGSFFQPEFVFAALYTLKTLPEKEWQCGYAEILKHALLSGEKFFKKFSSSNISGIDYKSEVLKFFILESVRFKSSIVSKDEKESGLRAILNLGHTTGHAIESLTSYKKYSHGEAVAMGLVIALEISVQKLEFNVAKRNEIIDVMKKYKLPISIHENPVDVLKHMKHDKKNKGDKLQFVLLREIGMPLFNIEIKREEALSVLKKWT